MSDEKTLTPMKAIRAKCIECSGGSSNEVKACELTDCPLYALRFGKRPNNKPREISDEQRAILRARMEAMQKKRRENIRGNDNGQ